MGVVRIEQDRAGAIVSAAVDRYKQQLDQFERDRVDRYIAKSHAELKKRVREHKLPDNQLEKLVQDMIQRGLAAELVVEVRKNVANNPQAQSVLDPLFDELDKLDKKIVEAINRVELPESEFKKANAEIYKCARKLATMAERYLSQPIYNLLPDVFARISLEDLREALTNVAHTSTALISSCKSSARVARKLEFENWLTDEFALRDTLYDEVERYGGIAREIATRATLAVSEVTRVENKIKEKSTDVENMTLIKYRQLMQEVLSGDDKFPSLSEKQQQRLLLDLELKHLKLLQQKCEGDIRARLRVEMENVNGGKKDAIIKIINNDYHEYEPNKTKAELTSIVNNPSPTERDVERNMQIVFDLNYAAQLKRKKMISRGFMLLGAGLALASVIAVIAAAPPLALVLLAVAVAACYVTSKIINKEESLDNVAQKGFRYFINKIRGVGGEADRLKSKVQLSSAEQLAKVNQNIKQQKIKKLFEQYQLVTKKDDLQQTAVEDAKKLCAIEGVKEAEADVQARIESGGGSLITASPKIAKSRNTRHAGLLVDRLQRAERAVTNVAYVYNFLPMSQVNDAASGFSDMVSKAMENKELQTASTVFGKTSLVKFKKQCQQAISVSAYVMSSAMKCMSASNMLQFDHWLKQRLVDRFGMQQEIKHLNEFIDANKTTISQNEVTQLYKELFSGAESERAVDGLSVKKFRQLLQEKLAANDKFMTLAENDQLYLIANLEKTHMERKLAQCEGDILARSEVEMNTPKYHAKAAQMADHMQKKYLGYEVDASGKPTDFHQRLISNIKHPVATVSDESKTRNAQITKELKDNFSMKRRKVVARTFLLIFVGLTLASLIAGFALAAPQVIAALVVGALAAAIIAKLVKKDESIKDIVSKGIKNLAGKVGKQFERWEVTKEMAEPKPAREKPETPVITPRM